MTSRPGRKITPRIRNRFQFLTAAATGVAAFGTLAGTGLVTGQVAASYDQENARKAEAARQAAEAARQAAAQVPVVINRRRPHRTVVRTVVVDQASSSWSAAPSSGGTIRQSTSRPTGHTTRPSSGTSRPQPAPAPKPAPKPAPAPSSGS